MITVEESRLAVAQMREFLDDPLHLAAALDIALHPYRGATLVMSNDNDELVLLTGYAQVAYTLTGDNFQPAWSVAFFDGPSIVTRHVFATRIEALHCAIERGYRFVY